MAQRRGTLFQQLTRLFRSGPVVKRKVRSSDTRVAGPDMTGQSSSVLLLSKTQVGNFNSIISGGQGYVTQERMSRLQDFNEMDAYAEINAALDIYADESVAQDAAGKSIHIHSDNPAIKKNLEELFYNTLNAEFNLRPWTRNLPVRKDTIIPLLDGRNVTIEELAKEHEAGKENWVYSVQDGTQRFVPGRVAWCGLTRQQSELVRVHIDDGTHVDCTPDHEWVMRDGSRRPASDLKPGESLMPFYRKVSSKREKDSLDGYEKVYDAQTGKYVYTHSHVVELIRDDDAERGQKFVTHHVDFNKRNNAPSNLRRMTVKFDERCVEMLAAALPNDRFLSSVEACELLKANTAFMNHFRAINQPTKADVAKSLTQPGIALCLKKHGHDSYAAFVKDARPSVVADKRFQKALKISESKKKIKNHKVDHVERLTETDDVYCMEVLGPKNEHDRHNFQILTRDSLGNVASSGICSTNCKYGDFYLYIDVSPEYGVINVVPIPVNELTREEGFDPHDPLAVRFRWMTLGNRTLENWEVAHFRLMGNDQYLPYGSSMLDGARRIWRQLVLIEDAMLVYRVTRSPERRVFYVDVGGVAPDEIANYMESAKTNIKSSQVLDRATGRVDLRYNPLSVEEDYWIPVRGSDTNTRIDTLQAGQNTGNVEDVQYIQKKLIAALKVPAAYLGYNDAIPGSSGLAQVDVRFSRTVNMIQRTVVSELNKIAMVHLFAAGFRGEDLIDFEIRLSNPSTIAQQQKLELLRTRFEIAGTAPPAGPGSEQPLMSERWIQRNVMGLNDQEILQNKRERLDDVRAAGAMEAAGVIGGGGEEAGGGADTGGGAEGGAEAGGAAPEAGGESNGPGLETAADDNRGQGDLITSTSMDGEPRVREADGPVKIMPGLKKALYNQRRNLRRRTHGKVNVLDRAVSGATARPSMPEGRSMLQEAFADVYNVEDVEEDLFDDDQSSLLKQEAVLAPTITVKPIVGQAELRMMRELSLTKNLTKLDPEQWDDNKRRERVLLEHFATSSSTIEHDDVKEFELYDEEVDEPNGD